VTPEQLTAWEKFYGLSTRPFSLTPDLRFAFNSQSHSRAFEQVTEALRRREGLIVVTGEIGTGKTMLCRTLLETFEARTFLSVILDPALTVDELLLQVLADFGLLGRGESGKVVPIPGATRHQLVTTLQQFLASLIPLNAHAVVMIDEAQQLDPSVLEQIRLLSNFETDQSKLLQIVLVGQPNLDQLLGRSDMRQLSQRIARRCELYPLSDAEVHEYVRRRLAVASEPPAGSGSERPSIDIWARPTTALFTTGALDLVARVSAGIPRVINTLCDRALEVGFERQARTLDEAIVSAAAERLKLPTPVLTARAPSVSGDRTPALIPEPARHSAAADGINRYLIAALVVLAFVGAAALVWSRLAQTSAPAPAAAPPASAPADSQRSRPRTPGPASAPAAPAAGATAPTAPAPESAGTSPADTTPAPTAAVTPASGSYRIAVAAFRTKQRANEIADQIKSQGLPTYIRTDPGETWQQVVVGPFKSSDEALSAQRKLAQAGFGDTQISVDR
jgi:general secretion pathway protein A